MTLDLSKLLVELGYINELPAPISDEDRSKISQELKRTGLGGIGLFKKMSNPPEGLSIYMVTHIVSGEAKTVQPSYLQAIISAYAKMPTMVRVSDKELEKLNFEVKRTGLNGAGIFARMTSPPEELNDALIRRIISGNNRLVKPEHLEALLKAYSEQPDNVYVIISEADHAKILSEVERTGLGGKAIYGKVANPPPNLTSARVQNIISGKYTTVEPEHIKIILQAYAEQPDCVLVEISDEDVIKMISEVERTGLGGTALFKKMKNPPVGLDGAKTHNIANGIVKTTVKGYVSAILKAYAEQPDRSSFIRPISRNTFEHLAKEAKRTGVGGAGLYKRIKDPPIGLTRFIAGNIVGDNVKSADTRHIDALIETYECLESLEAISKENAEKLASECERTGLGAGVLNRMENIPEGLNSHSALKIITGEVDQAPSSYVRAILEAYAKEPTTDRKPISQKDREKIISEFERTGLGGTSLYRYIKPQLINLTKGQLGSLVSAIVSGSIKAANPLHVKKIIETYAGRPDAVLEQVSDENKKRIASELNRTGLGGVALFKKMKSPPDGLDAQTASSIIAGNTTRTDPAYVSSILAAYKEQPDLVEKPIDSQDKKKIEEEAKRTGLGGAALFRKISRPPLGLTFNKARSITGRGVKADPAHVRAILKAYAEQPDNKIQPISKADTNKMAAEAKRTGVSGIALFNNYMKDLPEDITGSKISAIIQGLTKTADPELVENILSAYSSLPDAFPKPKGNNGPT